MMARGARFARGVAPHRDAAGHSLPSDRHLEAVVLHYICGPCWGRYRRRVTLIQFRATTTASRYTPTLLEELGAGRAVIERNEIPHPDGRVRYHYKLRCDRCGHLPSLNEDRVQERMASEYRTGLRERSVVIPLP